MASEFHYVVARELWVNTTIGDRFESVMSGYGIVGVYPGTDEGYDAAFKDSNDHITAVATRRKLKVQRFGGKENGECRIWFDGIHDNLVHVIRKVFTRSERLQLLRGMREEGEQIKASEKKSKKERK